MKSTMKAAFVCGSLLIGTGNLFAHCEVPCGIYDDQARVTSILEHATTIEKAMKAIEGKESTNQQVRWVLNKEKHAEKIQEIVFQYFLTQRIKSSTEHYHQKLESLHKMLVLSMKCKQTTDTKNVVELRKEVEIFKGLYFHAH